MGQGTNSSEERIFQYAYWPLLGSVMLSYGIPCFIWGRLWPDGYYGAEIFGLFSFPIAWAMRRVYRVRVTPTTLTCHNFWGLNCTTQWSALRSAKPFSLLTFSYLRIFRETGIQMWLPLRMADREGFIEYLRTHVPPNPVRTHFVPGETNSLAETPTG